MEDDFHRTQDKITARDLESPSPSERAEKIWFLLQQIEPRPTLWDLICFSVEALGTATAEFPILLATVKLVTRIVYGIHYNTKDIFPSAYRPNSRQVSGSDSLSKRGEGVEISPIARTESGIN